MKACCECGHQMTGTEFAVIMLLLVAFFLAIPLLLDTGEALSRWMRRKR